MKENQKLRKVILATVKSVLEYADVLVKSESEDSIRGCRGREQVLWPLVHNW